MTAAPQEARIAEGEPAAPERAFALLRRRDFRRLYAASLTSQLGDAFHYVALMWLALEAGGPLGVLAVRLADSIPAFLFGFHAGAAADRWPRRRTMIVADLVRAAVLVPLAVAGLAGELPLAALIVAAFVLTSATSYFEPAYGALLPSLVGRSAVQQANGLVQSSWAATSVAGWALAAALLALMPLSSFFALNAASFLASAVLLAGIAAAPPREDGNGPTRIREGFTALRPHPMLAAAVAVLGVAVTISAGTWIVGVPELVRSDLGRGAGAFSLVAASYALGVLVAGAVLAGRPLRRKALASLLAWVAYLPAYGCFALADGLSLALAGGFGAGVAQSAAWVLASAAAQEEVPDEVLGRVMGLIALAHRGGHATGLLLISPFFAVVEAEWIFAAAAVAIPLTGLAGAGAARALATRRTPRS